MKLFGLDNNAGPPRLPWNSLLCAHPISGEDQVRAWVEGATASEPQLAAFVGKLFPLIHVAAARDVFDAEWVLWKERAYLVWKDCHARPVDAVGGFPGSAD